MKVMTHLAGAKELSGADITVSVHDDDVTLTGTVTSGYQKVGATTISRKTDGVRLVNNKLIIQP